jgi:hypothetical protein
MRFMVMVKATKDSEAGVMPDTKLLEDMGKFNEELVKAGIMLAGEGLHPSSKGVRVRFDGDKRTVIDGPFAETKELVAGFWLWQVKSKEEAIEWVKRCPNPHPGQSEIEIRQVFELADFGPALTPELREAEERLRDRLVEKPLCPASAGPKKRSVRLQPDLVRLKADTTAGCLADPDLKVM